METEGQREREREREMRDSFHNLLILLLILVLILLLSRLSLYTPHTAAHGGWEGPAHISSPYTHISPYITYVLPVYPRISRISRISSYLTPSPHYPCMSGLYTPAYSAGTSPSITICIYPHILLCPTRISPHIPIYPVYHVCPCVSPSIYPTAWIPYPI